MQQTIITTLPLIPPFRSLIIQPAQLSLFRSMDISFDRILTQRPSSSDLDDPLFYTTPTTYSYSNIFPWSVHATVTIQCSAHLYSSATT